MVGHHWPVTPGMSDVERPFHSSHYVTLQIVLINTFIRAILTLAGESEHFEWGRVESDTDPHFRGYQMTTGRLALILQCRS